MAETLILHHYDASPFSEKIRKIFGMKRLAWRAVEQPSMMPKPDLIPLTGGYRRIPVLQIGADVYCDTQLIVRVLERLHPTPTLYPGASEGTCQAWNLWADRLVFLPAVATVFAETWQLLPPGFIEDRTRMVPGRDFSAIPKEGPHAREQLRALLAVIEAALGDGRPYLLGLGTLEPRKNLRRLVEAWRLLDDPPALALAGGEGWGDELELDGPGLVKLGYVADHEVPRLLRGAEALVFPSLFEGFGIPVVEAMACGTPVVASAHASLDEACGDAAVRVDPLDPAAIAAGIEDARARRDELVERGLRHAGGFSWKRAGEVVLRAYEEAAA